MSEGVRCIRIDSKNRTIEEVYRIIPKDDHFRENEIFGQTHLTLLRHAEKKTDRVAVIHYFSPDRYNVSGSVEWGYLFDERNPFDNNEKPQLKDAVGEGLLVEYRTDPENWYKNREAVDCTISLEEARKLIPEWTSGILRKIPEFTCILSESFDSPGNYDLKLRCESWDMLWDEHMGEATITHHTPRMMSLKVVDTEILVVCGAISDLKQNVRVFIHRIDDPSLHTLGASTMRAAKIPQWVKRTLEGHFKKIWIDDLREKDQAKRKLQLQRRTSTVDTQMH